MAQKAVGATSPRDPLNGRHDDLHGRLNKCRAGDLRLWGEHAHRARHLQERIPKGRIDPIGGKFKITHGVMTETSVSASGEPDRSQVVELARVRHFRVDV